MRHFRIYVILCFNRYFAANKGNNKVISYDMELYK